MDSTGLTWKWESVSIKDFWNAKTTYVNIKMLHWIDIKAYRLILKSHIRRLQFKIELCKLIVALVNSFQIINQRLSGSNTCVYIQ